MFPIIPHMFFTESHEKIKRALKHIYDFNSLFNDFFGSDFYSIHIDKDAEMRTNNIRFELHAFLDVTEAALIIGDVLHNLRSALDLMYYQVVLRCNGNPTKWTRFPIRDTRQELEGFLNGALKQKQITPAIQAFILDTIKPYKAGNYALWAVDDLNIMDKHQLLVPMLELMLIEGICLKDDKNIEIPIDPIFMDDSWSMRLRHLYGRNLTVHDKGHASSTILFHLGTAFEGKAVLPALNGIAEEVTRTIEAFDILIGRGLL